MSTNQSRSLQLWPRGTTVHVQGDVDSPECLVKFQNDTEPRKPTSEEITVIRRCDRAQLYVDREVLICDSSLVDELMKHFGDGGRGDLESAFSYEEVKNFRTTPGEWDLVTCKEWLDDRGIDLPKCGIPVMPTEEQVADALQKYQDHYDTYLEDADEEGRLKITLGIDDDGAWELEHDGTGTVMLHEHSIHIDPRRETTARMATALLNECLAKVSEFDEDDVIDEWRDLVRDNAEDAEIYEWWRVSSWLGEKLVQIGEPVLDNDYGCWWGRTCTGQSMLMDGTLQEVAALFD